MKVLRGLLIKDSDKPCQRQAKDCCDAEPIGKNKFDVKNETIQNYELDKIVDELNEEENAQIADKIVCLPCICPVSDELWKTVSYRSRTMRAISYQSLQNNITTDHKSGNRLDDADLQ